MSDHAACGCTHGIKSQLAVATFCSRHARALVTAHPELARRSSLLTRLCMLLQKSAEQQAANAWMLEFSYSDVSCRSASDSTTPGSTLVAGALLGTGAHTVFDDPCTARKAAWDVFVELLSRDVEDPTVSYYCANGLQTKVRQDWGTLAPQRRSELHETLWGLLQTSCMTAHITVIRRLSLALALVAIFSEGGPAALCHRAAEMVSEGSAGAAEATSPREAAPRVQQLYVGLELLKNMPEELGTADTSRGVTLRARRELSELSPMLLTLLQSVAATPASPLAVVNATEENGEYVASTFECLRAWCEAEVGITLDRLQHVAPGLLNAMLRALLALEVPDVLKASAEAIVACINATADDSNPDDPAVLEGRSQALTEVCRALAEVSPAWREAAVLETYNESVLWALSKLIAAVGEVDTEWVAQGSEAALVIVELLLEMSGMQHRNVATLPFEFWIRLQEVETVVVHDLLRAPAYETLLRQLVQQVGFPPQYDPDAGWGSSVGGALDSEEFFSYREGHSGVGDVLEACFTVLGAGYVEHLVAVLDAEGATWHTHEAVFFCLAKVGDDMAATMLRGVGDVETENHHRIMADHLGALAARLGTMSPSECPAVLVESACRWVSSVKHWIAAVAVSAPPVFDAALNFAASSLSLPVGAAQAAKTVLSLCQVSGDVLAQRRYVEALVGALEAATSAGLAVAERARVMTGIVRVVAKMPVADASAAVELIAAPMLNRMGEAVEAMRAAPSPDVDRLGRQTWYAEATVLKVVLQFLEMKEADVDAAGGVHPAAELLGQAWPLMESALGFWAEDSGVAPAIVDVYSRAIVSFSSLVADGIAPVIDTLVNLYGAYHYPACLNCFCAVVEAVGRVEDYHESLAALLSAVSLATFALVPNDDAVLEHADILGQFFVTCHRFVMFCPAAIVPAAELGDMMQLACRTIQVPKRETVTLACRFLHTLLDTAASRGPRIRPHLASLDAVLGDVGPALANVVVSCLVSDGDEYLVTYIAGVLYGVFRYCGDAGAAWFQEALDVAVGDAIARLMAEGARAASPADLESGLASLSDESRGLLLQTMRAMVGLSLPRFKALVRDFAGVCRFKNTKDSLAAYHDVLVGTPPGPIEIR